MKCLALTLLTIQLSVPLQVALFWHQGLLPATAARNRLTTRTSKLLDIPEILSMGVKQTLRALTFLSAH